MEHGRIHGGLPRLHGETRDGVQRRRVLQHISEKNFRDFYKILGDTDTAVEASQLLAKLTSNMEEQSRWTEIAAGVTDVRRFSAHQRTDRSGKRDGESREGNRCSCRCLKTGLESQRMISTCASPRAPTRRSEPR